MIYQPPAGARDLLPLEVVQKAWINDRLQGIFRQYGYSRIVTSTIEWLDTLTAGGAIQPSTVIQLQDKSEGTLGLRPEITASIARAAVTRMAGNIYPQRLCYRANVFRNPPKNHDGSQLEFYQAGVELLFAGGVIADTEILVLLANCLEDLGIPDWQILLGDAGLTSSLLSVFPADQRKQVRYCLANLDRIALENLDLDSDLKAKALTLFELRGEPETVLKKVTSLDLDPAAAATVKNLRSLINLLNQSYNKPLPLTLDLSLLKTFDYYTGIIFEAVSFHDNQCYLLGQGGRYDNLLGLYHPQKTPTPGIGFSLNIEDIHAALMTTEKLPQQSPASDWLVVADSESAQVAAFRHAETLRDSAPEIRVELDLGDRNQAEIKEYASTCRIKNIVWVKSDGELVVESCAT
ncbi:MAG: ATP phosphoribosyltransferase regulatory subunit [Xenococcaceae cyanobacterium MO_188.B19]|nr:ATP phosphoribosyltransferase regulatory subunit [Xenococcaceae cyanobacterium MO_188.B19]